MALLQVYLCAGFRALYHNEDSCPTVISSGIAATPGLLESVYVHYSQGAVIFGITNAQGGVGIRNSDMGLISFFRPLLDPPSPPLLPYIEGVSHP